MSYYPKIESLPRLARYCYTDAFLAESGRPVPMEKKTRYGYMWEDVMNAFEPARLTKKGTKKVDQGLVQTMLIDALIEKVTLMEQ
jgi:hypothetical protein